MNKKSQGISINIIIIAAIALIVLVVLVAIFSGQMGNWVGKLKTTVGDATKTCSEQEGNLEVGNECPRGTVQIQSSDASARGKICCKSKS
tara:strand:+ start:78 stop:347 length:270 start_codon:yes stop_codon:yes gene_type:complete